MGAIVVPTDDSNTIPPLSMLFATILTGVLLYTLSGDVTLSVQHNGVTIGGMGGLTVSSIPGIFVPTLPESFTQYDQISLDITAVTTPLGLVAEFIQ
jgi:hypothetical protein